MKDIFIPETNKYILQAEQCVNIASVVIKGMRVWLPCNVWKNSANGKAEE